MKNALVISGELFTVADLRDVLRQCKPAVTVQHASSLDEAASALCGGGAFDLTILDIDLPDSQRLHGAELLLPLCRDTPLVVVSATEPDDDVIRSVDIGASGYLLKTADTKTLLGALQQVLEGGIYLPEMPPEHFTWF